jgi:hypothetical protein
MSKSENITISAIHHKTFLVQEAIFLKIRSKLLNTDAQTIT